MRALWRRDPRITRRFTVVLAAVAIVLFGAFGFHRLESERQQHRAAVEREVRLVGRSLQVSIENALRDGQLPDVVEVVDQLERVDPVIDLLFFGADGALRAGIASDGSSASGVRALASAALASTEPILAEPSPGPPPHVLYGARIVAESGEVLGAIVLTRGLADLEETLRAALREVVWMVLLFAGASATLTALLGRVHLRRPLDRLVEAMRRVRGGDLTDVVPVARRDEVGQVAFEFNRMVEVLRETQERLREERETRRHLEQGLRAVDRLAAVGQLAAGLAHDIGSPLQVLTSRARGLQSRADEPEQVRRIALVLVEQTERITRIVQRLVAYAGARAPAFSRLRAAPLVTPILDLLDAEAKRAGVSLELITADDLPCVRADADEVQQVVFNLVANAIDASPRGAAVTVSLRADVLRVVDALVEVPAVVLEVADTGCGIPAELRPRVFEPFVTTRRIRGGTGLGLAVVRWIVDRHRGRVSFESVEGRGTRFIVMLPASEGDEEVTG